MDEAGRNAPFPDPARVPPERSRHLAPLFAERTTLRAVVDSVVGGHLGQAVADDPECPQVARLDLGCYAIFGGDPGARRAREMAAAVTAPRELVFPDSAAWRELLHSVHDPRLTDRPMLSFTADGLDPAGLTRMAKRVPPGFEVAPIDLAAAAELGPALEPHALQVFETPRDLVARGLGFCARRRGTVASAATSYAFSSKSVEVAIATRAGCRRLGLARAVASRLLLLCLERGLVPHWNAGNPASQRLAGSLGFEPAAICEVLFLGGGD